MRTHAYIFIYIFYELLSASQQLQTSCLVHLSEFDENSRWVRARDLRKRNSARIFSNIYKVIDIVVQRWLVINALRNDLRVLNFWRDARVRQASVDNTFTAYWYGRTNSEQTRTKKKRVINFWKEKKRTLLVNISFSKRFRVHPRSAYIGPNLQLTRGFFSFLNGSIFKTSMQLLRFLFIFFDVLIISVP